MFDFKFVRGMKIMGYWTTLIQDSVITIIQLISSKAHESCTKVSIKIILYKWLGTKSFKCSIIQWNVINILLILINCTINIIPHISNNQTNSTLLIIILYYTIWAWNPFALSYKLIEIWAFKWETIWVFCFNIIV